MTVYELWAQTLISATAIAFMLVWSAGVVAELPFSKKAAKRFQGKVWDFWFRWVLLLPFTLAWKVVGLIWSHALYPLLKWGWGRIRAGADWCWGKFWQWLTR